LSRSKSNTCTTDKFVEKAIKVHGNRYDYSKVVYAGIGSKVLITCPEHGDFLQTPNGHLKGRICKKCANKLLKKLKLQTLSEFVDKANSIHGSKYNYSKSVYIDAHSKLLIICPKHNKFYQTPNDHLSGCGCPKCGYDRVGEKRTLTQEKFIKKAIKVYGKDKYNYDKTRYINALTDVIVTCNIHGEFNQNAHVFLQGHGCQRCGYASYTLSECINKFKEIHGDIYDYSKVEYYNSRTKVCIICREHGEFWQKPNNHIDGQRCPNCHISYGELAIKKWFTENSISFVQQYKLNELKVDKKPLQFDFYLPEINTLIEYDGEQHYRPVRFNGISMERALANFKKSQYRDNLKNKFCEENKIPLIRIGYNQNTELPNILSKLYLDIIDIKNR
jgi:protein-arginine kinase activator protein McsA